ncbi:TPA: DUF551 domain-containing protein [Klebsiella pneumoniae]
MTKSTITRERLEEIVSDPMINQGSEFAMMARMALATMDSESECLPLDYLHGHKDGLEWAAQLAEANHPETGDWLYDDPIELAKAIRKGPDMPPVQLVADSEPVIVVGDDGGDALSYRRLIQSFEPGTKLYRHAQPAPVVPDGLRLALSNAGIAAPESDEMLAATCEKHIQALVTWVKDRKPFQSAPVVPSFEEWLSAANRKPLGWVKDAMREAFDACRAAMLAAAPQSPGSEPATVPGKWIPVSERMPEDRTQVILWDAEIGEVTSGHYSHKTQTFYHCGDAIENEITHWMLPPSAPQGVKP